MGKGQPSSHDSCDGMNDKTTVRIAWTCPNHFVCPEINALAKPNYQFDKRQRDLAKKKKQDEKRQRKQAKEPGDTTSTEPGDVPAS
jgi:hypothetical protein